MTLVRLLKFSLTDFWRNFWLSVVIITVFVLALLSFSFLFAFQYISDSAIEQVQNRVDIGVYFSVQATSQELESVKSYLDSLSEVREVDIISAEQAVQDFREKHAQETNIIAALDELGDNPLGPSLIVKAYEAKDYPAILSALEDAPHQNLIESKDFDDNEIVLGRIGSVKGQVQTVMLGIAIFFLFVSSLVIFNTIRIAIYSKREEIAIMKLVGANNTFVRVPFIITSALYALVAFLVALFIFFPLIAVVNPYFAGFLGSARFDILQYFIDNFITIFGTQVIGILLISMISSGIAVSRYMKV